MRRTIVLTLLLISLAPTVIRLSTPSGVRAAAGGSALSVAPPPQAQATKPIRTLPGLEEIRVWLGPNIVDSSFGPNHPALTERRAALDFSSFDIRPPAQEGQAQVYDVFYSNADGTINADGAYLTVEAASNNQTPGLGGGNVAEVGLKFSGATTFEYGNVVSSFVALGNNKNPELNSNAIDGNIRTYSTLGNTAGQTQRLRITIGFLSSSGASLPRLYIADNDFIVENDVGTSDVSISVTLSGAITSDVTVDYATENYSAHAEDPDYVRTSGTLTFHPGDESKFIVVRVLADRDVEPDERFFVNLSNAAGAIISRRQSVCTIRNDDLLTEAVCSKDVPKQFDRRETVSRIEYPINLLIHNVQLSYVRTTLILLPDQIPLTEYNLTSPAGTSISLRQPGRPFDADCLNWRVNFTGGYTDEPAAGIWTLGAREIRTDETYSLQCWCLEVSGIPTGLQLKVYGGLESRHFYGIPVSKNAQVVATVVLNGRPVPDVQVFFSVNDIDGRFPNITEERITNGQGKAVINYTRADPGRDRITAVARDVFGSMIGEDRTHIINWEPPLCPLETADSEKANAHSSLSLFRNFRDEELSQTPRGRRYTDLYYKVSSEAVQIMMSNPMLLLRSREIIERYKPVIQSMANGKRIMLTRGDLDEIDGFLNSFAAKGSPQLQEAVKEVCADLKNPGVRDEFHITVIEGPKREMPYHNLPSIIERVGGTSGLLGLCVVCALFLARCRDNSSKNKAKAWRAPSATRKSGK
jgi:Calx-beta domain-containing protein